MAIMPQIAMGFQMPQIQLPNQGNMLMQVAQLQQMQEANALRQAQARKLQLEEERGNALVQALRGGQPTLDRLVEADPIRGFAVYKAFQEQQKAQEQQDEERRKKFVSAIYGSFENPSLPSYGRSVRFLQQQKLTDPELDKFLGDLMFVDDATRKQQLSTLLNAIPGGGDYIRAIAQQEANLGETSAKTAKLLAEGRDVGKEKPTADIQNYRQAVEQGFKGSFVDYQTLLKREGRSEVNVPVTVADRDQGNWMDALRKEGDALKSTPGFIKSLESARALIPQATTGAGAEVITNVANFARNRLGIEIDSKTVTSEQLRSQLFQGIIANLRQIDAQPTQSQQAALSQAIGTIGSDPKALDKILTFWADLSRARVDEFNRKVDESEKSGFKAPYNPRIKLPEPPSKESSLSPQIKAAIEWVKDPKNASDPTLSAVQDRLRFLGVIE
jgi:hypothetical protein